MPQWTTGELPDAPRFGWRNLAGFIGPAVVTAAGAIGGGEWLTGPVNTAWYGPGLFWLCTLSILGQVIYNIEVSRYTLYTGEPIITGKFRIPPGPWFFACVYLFVDLGSFFPYLAANAAIPLGAMFLGDVPTAKDHPWLIKLMGCGVFLSVFIPLLFGGKVYYSMRKLMTFKLFYVFGLLLFLAACFSTWPIWKEVLSGFVEFGNVPVVAAEDLNANSVQDPGEAPHRPRLDNIFVAWREGRPLLPMDLSLIAFLMTMAAISGNGGLTNTNLSNYTRDQGWGMGAHVGAIPSMIGGKSISLSHEGQVFEPNAASLPRWKRWMWHVQREQLCLWMPACFVGIALPSLLSLLFLDRGHKVDPFQAAGLTANGVRTAVAEMFSHPVGQLFWYLTLFCGFLVLGTSMASAADGVLRRWVDVFWTASPRLRQWDPKDIRYLYFGVMCVYATAGVLILLFLAPPTLVGLTGMLYNVALGASCFHVTVVNSLLLPRPLRPSILTRLGLACAGTFFLGCAGLSAAVYTLQTFPESTAAAWCRSILSPLLT